MRSIILWVLFFLFSIFLQTTLMPSIAVQGIYPDAILIVLFILSIEKGRMVGIWSGFIVGLLVDVYSTGPLGCYALAKTCVGGFVGFFTRRSFNCGPILQLVVLIIASMFHDIIAHIATVGLTGLSTEMWHILPRAAYTALLSSFLLFALHYLYPPHRRY